MMIPAADLTDTRRYACRTGDAPLGAGSDEYTLCGPQAGMVEARNEETASSPGWSYQFATVYRLYWSNLLGILVGSAFLVVIVLVCLVEWRYANVVEFLVGTLFLVLTLEAIALIVTLSLQTRLVLSPQGIEYHGFGTGCYTTWDNVVGGTRSGLQVRAERVLSYNMWGPVPAPQPPLTYASLALPLPAEWSAPQRSPSSASLTDMLGGAIGSFLERNGSHVVVAPSAERMISTQFPLEYFAFNWRQSELGSEIDCLAPQVFGQAPAALLQSVLPPQEITPPPSWPVAPCPGSLRRRLRGLLVIHGVVLVILAVVWTVVTT